MGLEEDDEVMMEKEMMDALHNIVILIFFVYLLHRYFEKRQERQDLQSTIEKSADVEVENVSKGVKNMETRDLFLDILTEIGCQYQLGEGNDNRIFFAYSGENFFADTSNESPFVHLWDSYWECIDLYDIDEVSRVKRAINSTNMNTGVSTVYTVDEDEKSLYVHSKMTIPFLAQMPQLGNYLKSALNEFFRAHQFVWREMMKLREKEA